MTGNWMTELINNLGYYALEFLKWLWNDATTQQVLLLIYFDISLAKATRRARRQTRDLLQRELHSIRRRIERQTEWLQKRRLKNVYDKIIKENQQG